MALRITNRNSTDDLVIVENTNLTGFRFSVHAAPAGHGLRRLGDQRSTRDAALTDLATIRAARG